MTLEATTLQDRLHLLFEKLLLLGREVSSAFIDLSRMGAEGHHERTNQQ
jgi:hypothetical protein